MFWEISLLLAVLVLVGVLGLRLVPKRWASVDIRVGPKGLRLKAEESPTDSE